MSLKDSIKEAFEKTFEEGGKMDDWFAGISFMKFLGGLLTLGVIGLTIFFGIALLPQVISDAAHQAAIKNCKCENFDADYVFFDYEEMKVKTRCDFCHREKNLNAVVTEVFIDQKPNCLDRGYRMESWTVEEYPSFYQIVSYYTKPTGHTIGDIIFEAVEPTCSSEGKTAAGYCAYCMTFIEAETIPTLEHNFVDTEYIAATCTSYGYTAGSHCSECGYEKKAISRIPFASHSEESGHFEGTYSHGEYEGTRCKNCHQVIKVNNLITEAGISEFLEYQVSGNNCIITKIIKCQEEFDIPDYINGYKVIELSEGLFKDDITLEKVSLPTHITKINKDTFNGCVNLKEITIPDNVTEISDSAFKNCTSLRKVDLGNGVVNVGAYAFDNCNGILSFRFSPNIDYSNFFTDNVFPIFPYNRTDYSSCHFSISVLYIPESMRGLDLPNHEHLYYIEEVHEDFVYEENGYYWFEEKGYKELLGYDKELVVNNSVIIPNGCEVIGENFFYHNEIFSNFVVPKTVYKICRSYRPYVSGQNQMVYMYYEGEDYEGGYIVVEELEVSATYTESFSYLIYASYKWYLDENGLPVLK